MWAWQKEPELLNVHWLSASTKLQMCNGMPVDDFHLADGIPHRGFCPPALQPGHVYVRVTFLNETRRAFAKSSQVHGAVRCGGRRTDS